MHGSDHHESEVLPVKNSDASSGEFVHQLSQ